MEPVAAAIAMGLAKKNYRLILIADEKRKINKLIRDIKAAYPGASVECQTCAVDASWEADIIITAVPADYETHIADKIRSVSVQKIIMVLSACADSLSEGNLLERSISVDLQQLMPHSKIVKVFTSSTHSKYEGSPEQHSLSYCLITGNDPQTVETVSQLMKAAGFNHTSVQQLHMNSAPEKMPYKLFK